MLENLSLDGKTVVITGGGTGLGREMVLAMARAGADMVIASRRPGPIEAVADMVREIGPRALAVSTDVTDTSSVSSLFDKTPVEFGKVDGLFNKAGDLYAKTGNVTAAVELYERAANRYAESGFPNNAIALCNKILRASPGRTAVYLKLAKLMLERGFVAEAKRNLWEEARRMTKAGQG